MAARDVRAELLTRYKDADLKRGWWPEG